LPHTIDALRLPERSRVHGQRDVGHTPRERSCKGRFRPASWDSTPSRRRCPRSRVGCAAAAARGHPPAGAATVPAAGGTARTPTHVHVERFARVDAEHIRLHDSAKATVVTVAAAPDRDDVNARYSGRNRARDPGACEGERVNATRERRGRNRERLGDRRQRTDSVSPTDAPSTAQNRADPVLCIV
jgi:hypothetical protein